MSDARYDMTGLSVSVVVVSRGRPEALTLCLIGLGQLIHPNYEIVVVADPKGVAAVSSDVWDGRIKTVAYDEPNISIARNLGIEMASGDVVAFIDDDAVPEPTWLAALTAPFANPDVMAAGGFVRGRNGISLQWCAREAFSDGTAQALMVDTNEVSIHRGQPGRAIKTEGTNMAFRRPLLAELGGFDPAFRFYLDETDLNMRLARAGHLTAIVPLAQVHHGYAASARRRADRVPRDLFEIGASLGAFVLRHGARLDTKEVGLAERQRQKARLINHMVAGRIEPRDVGRLLDTFDDGWKDGLNRRPMSLRVLSQPSLPFLTFGPRPYKGHKVLSCRPWQLGKTRAKAVAAAGEGYHVSLFSFGPTVRKHSIRFCRDGYWLQSGGLFGPAHRSEKRVQFWRFSSRLQNEVVGLSKFRRIPQLRIND